MRECSVCPTNSARSDSFGIWALCPYSSTVARFQIRIYIMSHNQIFQLEQALHDSHPDLDWGIDDALVFDFLPLPCDPYEV